MRYCLLVILLVAAGFFGFALGQRESRQRADAKIRALNQVWSIKEAEARHRAEAKAQLIDEALYAPREFDRHNAFQEFTSRRQEEIRKLIDVIGKENGPPMTRYFAARLLRLYRDPAAMQVLVKNLDWEYLSVVTEMSYLNGYPCAQALAAIGPECSVEVLRDLARDEARDFDQSSLRLRSFVLESVCPTKEEAWGRDNVVGVVERYIERIPPQWKKGKENVERLLEMLKKRPTERFEQEKVGQQE